MVSENADASHNAWRRFSNALSSTRRSVGEGIGNLLLGKKELSSNILEDLGTQLLVADVGVATTDRLIEDLQRGLRRNQLGDGEAALAKLRASVTAKVRELALPFEIGTARPFVILVVGVNGVGKTTTIGKLTARFQRDGYSVLLAAGDTYRAAAIEQLQTWGERSNVPVIAQRPGSDSASVIFDAIEAAAARDIDVVIADTAGRLQNKTGLMAELAKVKRVIQKADPTAPHETLLVLDAGVGQNALSQVQEFRKTVDASGLVLTKLDGTAKGGSILGLAFQQPLPLYFVGLGEGLEDLHPFSAEAYVDGLFAQ